MKARSSIRILILLALFSLSFCLILSVPDSPADPDLCPWLRNIISSKLIGALLLWGATKLHAKWQHDPWIQRYYRWADNDKKR